MGGTLTKPRQEQTIAKSSLEIYGTDFAKIYVECVLLSKINDIPFISKMHHLMLFIKENGDKNMYSRENQYFSFYNYRGHVAFNGVSKVSPQSKHNCYLWISQYCAECMIYLYCVATNELENKNSLTKNETQINFNIDCFQLNKYVKQQAIAELAIQQHKQKIFTPDNIQMCKNKILEIDAEMKRNEEKIRDAKQIYTTIQQIIDANTKLNEHMGEYAKIVEGSKITNNNIEIINQNIVKLQQLIKIIVCDDIVEQQTQLPIEEVALHFPIAPTHVPVVFPIVPDTPITAIAYATNDDSHGLPQTVATMV